MEGAIASLPTTPAENPSAPPRIHVKIRPPRGWAAINVHELWEFRDLLMALAQRDVKLRYKQTALGVIWVVLQPLLAAGIFTFVFGLLAKMPSGGKPFFLISFTGLLGWNLFNNVVTRASGCLVGNSQLISKIFFPRLLLPLSTVPSALIDFAVALAMMVVLMFVYRVTPSPTLLALPLWIIVLLLSSAGVGMWSAALAVSYRDVQYIVPVVLQMLFYASPAAYEAALVVPQKYRTVYYLNPLASILDGFRWSLIGSTAPQWNYVVYSIVISTAFFVVGAYVFKKMERRFADVI
jgi:lipopolysaccharide transport system permease protein